MMLWPDRGNMAVAVGNLSCFSELEGGTVAGEDKKGGMFGLGGKRNHNE